MGGGEKAIAAAQVTNARYGDVSVALEEHVAWVEMHRPPHNFFDRELIGNLADAFEALDRESQCRALVLASEGKSFCAGADFSPSGGVGQELESARAGRLYEQAIRLFGTRKPVVAAIQGAAVGGGLGLALAADFRVVTPEARFAANFAKLGLHPGFGLTHTLPRLIGVQRASLMFYTARRIGGELALSGAWRMFWWRRIGCARKPASWRARSPKERHWLWNPCGPPCGADWPRPSKRRWSMSWPSKPAWREPRIIKKAFAR